MAGTSPNGPSANAGLEEFPKLNPQGGLCPPEGNRLTTRR